MAKPISKDKDHKDRTIITVERRFLFWTWQTQYVRLDGSWTSFVKMPNMTIIGDMMCYQLGQWENAL